MILGTPKPEDCSNDVDDDCDGVVNQPSAGCVCTPKMSESCYDGPPGTETAGICMAGTRVCNDDGKGWGTCTGESIGVDSMGNVFLAGTLGGLFSVDGMTYGFPNTENGLLLKLDSSGKVVWVKKFGGAQGDHTARSLAVDGSGNVVLAGRFANSVDLGAGTVTAAGTRDLYLAKYTGDGQPIYLKTYGAAGVSMDGTRIASDSAGNAAIVGTLDGQVDFGNGVKLYGANSPEPFLLRVDASGNTFFGFNFSAGSPVTVRDVHFDSQGGLVYAGSFQGSVGTLVVPHSGTNGFIGSVDAVGQPKWAVQIGTSTLPTNGATDIWRAALDDQNGMWVVGFCAGQLDIGATLDCGDTSPFVMKTDSTAKVIWQKGFKNAPGAFISATFATSAFGFVGGANQGQIDLGTGTLTAASTNDLLLAKFATR
jgi:hypothetical protein